ncbi:MAG TPA: HipA domain-containing protein [Candidatus Binatus sp.]|nr:HipA domain-containing protein [Candidatus Binatus sp.]
MPDSSQKHSSSPALDLAAIPVPTKFKRNGKRGHTWHLPRTFPGYFADTSKQVLGAAPKYVIRSEDPKQPEYLVKYAQKHGKRETFTEFFLNQLGTSLGFTMAHSGLVLLDNRRAFLTTIFTSSEETLRHGSLIIEDYFKDEKALDRVRPKEEQAFYSIDFVANLLKIFCGKDFEEVFPKFIEMLVFDALIGSMDRHAQNWGVVGRIIEPSQYRFAPIFDTARALIWSLDEAQISRLWSDSNVLRNHLERARPCLGPERTHPKVNDCNHFDFVENLLMLYPHQTSCAIRKVPGDIEKRSAKLLRRFPFRMAFSGTRKRLIAKILGIRAARLHQILNKRRAHDDQAMEVSL